MSFRRLRRISTFQSVATDPVAAWTEEGDPIDESAITLDEIEVVFKKLAGLVVVTNELVADGSPEVTSLIGEGLSADLARKIDAAYFAATPVVGAPSGLGGITPTDVDAGSAWNNTDAFVSAIYSAASLGVPIKSFVANPADAEILAKIKQQTGIDSDDNLVDSVSNTHSWDPIRPKSEHRSSLGFSS